MSGESPSAEGMQGTPPQKEAQVPTKEDLEPSTRSFRGLHECVVEGAQ